MNGRKSIKSIKSHWDIIRQRIYIIIYGTSTFAGRLFDLILLVAILFSIVLVMLESMERMDARFHKFLVIGEWIITIFFTIEYILRLISNKKPLQYVFSFFGIVDLVSILPMYISFIFPGSKVLSIVRALRLLRIFRILNLVTFTGQASQLKLAIKASRTKIFVFVYFVLVVATLLGAVMYAVEGPENGFTSIPTGIYWCIVTLTTVGYGDIAPVTPLGQFIATFIMILGYGIIAVPTGIVTAELARSKRVPGDKFCPNCYKSDHREEAKHCYNCGYELK